MEFIAYEKEPIPYNIIRSRRKTLSIEISIYGDVTVRVPQRMKLTEIQKMVELKRKWISQKRTEMLAKNLKVEKFYEEGSKLYYLGREYKLKIEKGLGKNSTVIPKEEEIILYLPEEYELGIKVILREWYYNQAAEAIKKSVERYATLCNVTYQRITIRDQKTRWGSCSTKGNLNFNFRLIMAPPEVLDYVVVHELCHRIHMNHSQLFWDEVGKVLPDYQSSKEWLKQHTRQLEL